MGRVPPVPIEFGIWEARRVRAGPRRNSSDDYHAQIRYLVGAYSQEIGSKSQDVTRSASSADACDAVIEQLVILPDGRVARRRGLRSHRGDTVWSLTHRRRSERRDGRRCYGPDCGRRDRRRHLRQVEGRVSGVPPIRRPRRNAAYARILCEGGGRERDSEQYTAADADEKRLPLAHGTSPSPEHAPAGAIKPAIFDAAAM